MPATLHSGIPLIDLSKPDFKHLIVKACEEFGFFKVINHGLPLEFITDLESQAVKFFSLPLSEKEKAGPPAPSGYCNKRTEINGDIGWVEYLLFTTNACSSSQSFTSVFGDSSEKFRYDSES
jgi:gibberellin 2-oxidase